MSDAVTKHDGTECLAHLAYNFGAKSVSQSYLPRIIQMCNCGFCERSLNMGCETGGLALQRAHYTCAKTLSAKSYATAPVALGIGSHVMWQPDATQIYSAIDGPRPTFPFLTKTYSSKS